MEKWWRKYTRRWLTPERERDVFPDPFDIFREFEQRFEDMREMLRRMLRPFEEEGFLREPVVDIEETDNEIIVRAELPGMEKEDIDIEATEDTLIIAAKHKKEEIKRGKSAVFARRGFIGFYREIPLPTEVIPEKAKATYRNGVLEIILPKARKSRGRRIKID